MAWFVIIRRDNGEAVSFGTVVSDTIPPGMEAVRLPDDFSTDKYEWDVVSRSARLRTPPAPVPTQLERIEAKLDELLTRLPATARIP